MGLLMGQVPVVAEQLERAHYNIVPTTGNQWSTEMSTRLKERIARAPSREPLILPKEYNFPRVSVMKLLALKLIRSAAPPIVMGVTASLLVLAGQCVVQAKEKHEQQREIARLVIWLEQQTSRNPVQVSVVGMPDILPEAIPRDSVLISGFLGQGDEVEVYLTSDALDNAREELRLSALKDALDTLSLLVDSRATLVSAEDRHSFRIAIHDTNAAITQFIALRGKTATNRNGKRFVGLATHVSEKFFNRLRHSVEWLSACRGTNDR